MLTVTAVGHILKGQRSNLVSQQIQQTRDRVMNYVDRRTVLTGVTASAFAVAFPATAMGAGGATATSRPAAGVDHIVTRLATEFTFDGRRLGLKGGLDGIAKRFNLTSAERATVEAILQRANSKENRATSSLTQDPLGLKAPEVSSPTAGGGARLLYLDYHALTAGVGAALYSAAQVGPAALMAAWTVFTAAMSGPIAVGAAILGGTFFADLGVKIIGAVAQQKGIAIYAQWGIPPLRSEIE